MVVLAVNIKKEPLPASAVWQAEGVMAIVAILLL